jgi:hypothetical protein
MRENIIINDQENTNLSCPDFRVFEGNIQS